MSQSDLVKKFLELGDQIVSALGKDKKRNKASRTATYQAQKIAEATLLWTNYNDVLKQLKEIISEDDPCIKDAAVTYTKAYKEYTDRLLAINNDRSNQDDFEDNDDEPSTTILILQEKRLVSLIKILDEVENKQAQQETPTSAYSVIKSNKIKEMWKKIEGDDELINENVVGFRQYKEKVLTTEEVVDNALIFLQEQIGRKSAENGEGLKLNRIEIAKFGGDYFKWLTFKDLFESLVVNNKKLGKAEKMHHLKSSITGDPEDMIRDLTVSEVNFDSAWARLMERYNNERVIVTKMLNKLMMQPICKGDSKSIRKLLDTTDQIILALKNLKRPTEKWDDWITVIVSQKLDESTQKDWEKKLGNKKEMPTWVELKELLEEEFRMLERVEASHKRDRNDKGDKQIRSFQASVENMCVICNEAHKLFSCQKWKKMDPEERLLLVKKQKWCKCCLRNHADKDKCERRCKTCNKRHSTWLHQTKTETQLTVAHGAFGSRPYEVLLATAMIKVQDGNGNHRMLRVLLDSGSEGSLITQAAASILNRKTIKSDRWVEGLDGKKSIPLKKMHLTIHPRFTSTFSLQLDFYILPTLTKMLPGHDLDPTSWKHIQKMVWADPKFFKRGQIDALLGMDALVDIMNPGIIQGIKGQPMAQETKLGWAFSGKIDPTQPSTGLQCLATTSEVNNDLCQFWESEELYPERELTADEIECEKFYESTVRKATNGKFIVKIPFKNNPLGPERLGDSKGQAIARFLQIEKKIARDQFLKVEYKKAIQSYIDMGHMKEVTHLTKENKLYYIPHHAIVKPDHLTTKVRVVFDASARTTTGWSLNECMHVGAKQQRDLNEILISWRLFKVVYKADIEKMYRQIELDNDDQRYHTIIWRNSPSEELREYQLTATTFGTAAAPFLATRTLIQIAEEQRNNYPLAAAALKKNFYVDDLLGGNHSIDEADKCKNELLEALNKHHLPLRKWSSNSQEFLDKLPAELTENTLKQTVIEDDTSKALGLLWNHQTDTFSYKINWLQSDKTTWTKRQFLSETSKLFDPLGWLSPITINAKLLMQEVWLLTIDGLGWDDDIPPQVAAKWVQFRKEFKQLEQIQIKRWINFVPGSEISLHGFSDASEKAYSAVIYARVVDNGNISTTLLTSKTRVAPVKSKLTLPQLELCGALLTANLMQVVITSLTLENAKNFLWTDSMVTLGWIRSGPNRWKTFVANRVAKIQSHSNYKWDYVPTDSNPADCASRGIMPAELVNHPIWWTGPHWLSKSPEHWPSAAVPDHDLEQKRSIAVNTLQFQDNDTVESISSWFKLRRIAAYGRRLKTKGAGPLSAIEIRMAELGLIRQCQLESFYHEINDLLGNRQVHNKSKLKSLNVFLDKENILRVGGRLTNAQLPYDAKHPMVLPAGKHLTKIIIHQMHLDTHHGGPKLMKSLLKHKYWIIQCTRMVHTEYSQCVVCRKANGESYKQQMGDLPAARVTLSRAFNFTGVDYAGPVEVKSSNLRNARIQKGYIALFVCMGTKAVHLELVSDQTTKAFLAAFNRFTARRGLATEMFSDNGSNFDGANNQIQRLYCLEQNQKIAEVAANNGVKWNFIPPGAPNFGGLWERSIRSMKDHLKRTLKNARLTFEEYATVLCQVEACMNSRPLCSISDNIDDLDVLTPGHFLIGQELLAPPQPDMKFKSANNRDRWMYVQWLQHQLWTRWNNEYLVELQQRHKWQATAENAKPGDVVAIKDEDLPPRKWLVGKIEEVTTGNDNRVRVATIRVPARKPDNLAKTKKDNQLHMQSKVIQRPIRKLCPLLVEDKEQEMIKQHATQQQPRKTYKLRPRTSHLMTAMLIFFALLFGTAAATADTCIQTTLFKDNSGIFFEDLGRASMTKSNWKIIIYFDLNKYNNDINMIKNAIDKLTDLCKVAETAISNPAGQQCSYTIDLIKQQLDDILQMNTILQQNKQATRPNRTKRAAPLNFVGWLGNKFFGILDAATGEKIEKQIADIKSGNDGLTKLIAEQTSIINLTENLLKETQFEAQQRFNILTEAIVKLSNETDLYRKRDQIIGWAFHVSIVMNNIEKRQEKMIDMLTDLQQGHVSSYLFTPEQFKQELNQVNDLIPNGHKLPFSPHHDMKSFYEVMRGRMRVTKDKILLETLLPLVSTDELQVFHLIPVPVQHNNEQVFIIPESQYLLITLKRDIFYQLNEKDMNKCIETHDMPIICPAMHPSNSITSPKGKCERELLAGSHQIDQCTIHVQPAKDVWIQLKTQNHWIFGLQNSTMLNVVQGSSVDTVPLQGNGIISIQPGCEISYHGSTMIGQSDITTTTIHKFLPSMNLSNLIKENQSTAHAINLTMSHVDRFHKINYQMDIVKDTVNMHKQQNSVFQGIMIIMVTLMVVTLIGLAIAISKHRSWFAQWWPNKRHSITISSQNGATDDKQTSAAILIKTETSSDNLPISADNQTSNKINTDMKAAHNTDTRHRAGGCPFRT